MGNRAGEIHSIAGRNGSVADSSPKNLNCYRITDGDRLDAAGLKQKFLQNLRAVQIVRKLETEARPATKDEKALLVKFAGWGALPQVFDKKNSEWKKEREALLGILSDEEYESARATTLNAHYTSPAVIRAMYQTAQRFGFQGGNILEPACGVGHFIGLMPEEMLRRSAVTGVEIDPLSARITKELYPDADIRAEPFEKSKLPDQSFDLAISNVPFGDYRVHDPRWNKYKFSIHDYFFAAAMDKVRPDGLVMFITSYYSMDKLDSSLRELLTEKAELLGAIRLPNNAFKKIAGTDVTTDIIMLRKLRAGESPCGTAWKAAVKFTNERKDTFWLNEYFVAHPEMMLGKMRLGRGLYRNDEPFLEPDKRDLSDALAQAVEKTPRNVYQSQTFKIAKPEIDQTIPAPDYIKPNAFCIHQDGRVCIREHDTLRPLDDVSADVRSRIRRLIEVRDAVRVCLRTQLDDRNEEEVVSARERLNLAYDRFLSRFGPINARPNQNAFDGDPDLPLLLSLEQYDEEKSVAVKAAIFRERTIHKKRPIEVVNTPKEALLVSLNEKNRVDLDHMAKLLDKSAEEILPDLKGVIFFNPKIKQWETEDRYLSGNVREKLAEADAASVADSRFRENVEALKLVQPQDLPASEIDARLGASWLPTEDVRQFTQEMLGIKEGIEIRHIHELGSWKVTGDFNAKRQTANETDWGTNRYTALELIEATLNLKTPTVFNYDKKTKKHYINEQATEAARDKQERIKEKFKSWVFADDDRRERLARLYNDTFNHTRLRTFNGAHLTLPGASLSVQLDSHQKTGVWRILQTPNTLLAHVVGAGKTYTMVAAAMELKRLGLAKKPLFTVPNHMLGQFSTELLTLYPGANILVAGKEDFTGDHRRKLFSRIATGNWDAVIVTHSGFERIPVSPEMQSRFIKEQIAELQKLIHDHDKSKSVTDKRLVKRLEKAKKRMETKLQDLAASHKKDNTLTFEELGVDRLFVDEAQAFKNLFYVSKMTRIAGLPQTASERAFDMFLKVRHIQSVNNGGGVIFATGTPISNTLAEMFTMQRYLQPEILNQQKLTHFDSWAATFGEPVSAMELAPSGGEYRLQTRFARFVNVPELMQMFCQTADIQTAEMLNLPRPKLEGEKPIVCSANATPELKRFIQTLVKRVEEIKSGGVKPKDDNMLKVTTDGRKAALDLRLVLPDAKDDPDSKVNLALKNVFRIWEETKENRLTQLVFCDLSTPRDEGFSIYRDMAEKLVRLGIPREEIAFIHDFDSDAAKLVLFRQFRAGKIRILFGSTQKMGSGTNVQERLIASHYLDAPFRPADVAQRDGRILRQGNKNPIVLIYHYVTNGSFDVYMWQGLETKARFIGQVMSGNMNIRRIEDLDSTALTYAEIKAIASNNKLIIEKARIEAELLCLTRLSYAHQEEQYRISSTLRHTKADVQTYSQRLSNLEDDLKRRQNVSGDRFRIELDKQIFNHRAAAGEWLIQCVKKFNRWRDDMAIGKFAGFDLSIRSLYDDSIQLVLKGKNHYIARVTDTALGTIRSLESEVQGLEDYTARLQTDIRNGEKQIKELSAKVGTPFEHKERYEELEKRQAELEKELGLTKNQAPAQVEESPDEESEEEISPKQTASKTKKQTRKVAVCV